MSDWREKASDDVPPSGAARWPGPAGLRPLSRPPLHAVVTDRLRGMIVELHLRPGQRINELDLADRLEVSRTPLREALKVLQAEGLVVQHPNRSSFISHITPQETAELFEALAGLERLGGELTARHIDRDALERFRAVHEEMFAFHSAGERASYFELNDCIHRGFVELSGNARLVGFHAKLMAGATRIRYAVIQHSGRWDESVAEHKQILAAIEARAAKEAGELIERHVLETGTLACDILEAMNAAQSPQRPGFARFRPDRDG